MLNSTNQNTVSETIRRRKYNCSLCARKADL